MAVDTTTGTSTGTASRASEVHAQLRGLDSLDAADGAPRGRRRRRRGRRRARPSRGRAAVGPVAGGRRARGGSPEFWTAIGITMTRGLVGFAISAVVGLALGVVVARSKVLRSAIGSMITGLQTMPSIAWFPLAILLFQLSEQAILFVILIGAVPSIANGVITGVDYVPGLLVRAGRNLGAPCSPASSSSRSPTGRAWASSSPRAASCRTPPT